MCFYQAYAEVAALHGTKCCSTSKVALKFISCRNVGLPGTVAVVAAYYWHLDPYGHLHWNSMDALIGLACVAPLAVLGKFLTSVLVLL